MNITDNSSQERRSLKEFLGKIISLVILSEVQLPIFNDTFSVRYDPKTHIRTSPDMQRFRDADGVGYNAQGIRDEVRSPKQDLSKYIFSYLIL